MDGFPRNLEQANQLDSFQELDDVIVIDISDEESVKRITNRRSCPKCNKVYNVITNPPKIEGICDKDNTPLILRDDDKEEAIKKRLNIYHTETKPIVSHYEKMDKVIHVKGMKSIQEVTEDILSKLE